MNTSGRLPLALTILSLSAAGCVAADSTVESSAGPRAPVALIVEGDWVITMERERTPIADGAVAIDDGRIVAVGTRAEIGARFAAAETIPGAERIVMPGLVNGHGHAAMTLLRGVADDIPLKQWLEDYIFPAEVELVDAHFVEVGTRLACWEMIRGGTTTFVDMYYFPDAVAAAVDECGLRAIIIPGVIDQVAPDAANGEQSLAQGIDFVARWKGRHPRIIPAMGGHAIYTLEPETLDAVRDAATAAGVPVGIHLAESEFEVAFAEERYGETPIRFLEGRGFFTNKVIGAHVVYPSVADMDVLARRDVGVIHNPTSNMKIASGVSPVAAMLDAGVSVGLGTDGPASNNDLDMWEEIRLAAFLQKVDTMEPSVLPAATVIGMATRDGAAAIGLGSEIGQLRDGYRADVIQVSTADLSFLPMYEPVSHLAYVADEHDVTTVIVEGRVLMREKTVVSIDERELRSEASAIVDRIRDHLFGAGDRQTSGQ